MTSLESLGPVRSAARPGPGPIPSGLLRKLDLTVRRRVDGLLAGEHRAWFLGDGTELAQVREYVLGDDVRRIDWNVTARTGEPHVRVHVAERAADCRLLLDTSPSMTFGTSDRRKWDVAEGAALAVAHLATRRGNRLGISTFGDTTPVTAPARQGAHALLPLLHAIRREPDLEPSGPTSLGRALRRLDRMARRRSIVVVVSDFRGPRDWKRPLLRLAARHQVVAVEIRDPRELELVDVGDVWLLDPESHRAVRVDTRDRRLRAEFGREAAAERAEVSRELRSAEICHVVLSTAGDWLKPLVGALVQEKRRR